MTQPMKFFLDTHDQRTKTFPAGISREQFERTRERFNPEEPDCMPASAVAEAYVAVIEQDRSAWTSELDLRPPR